MEFLKFDINKCVLCGVCVEKCPFGALTIEGNGIVVGDACRMCGLCVRNCPEKAIRFEQKAKSFDKDKWKNFLIYVEQERGEIHPVTFELIGEARKMAVKVGYQVNCVIVGGKGTKENAEKLLPYGVDNVYVYEHEGFEGFRADCYTDAVADCIAANKPSSVLIGATALGRSLAPRLSTRFHTGLTADCTTLDIRSNTDMIQIRPAFGGNIMAQIGITKSRPQFATVRYKVMDKAEKVKNPHGQVVVCPVNEKMADSRIKILSSRVIDKVKSLEEEDVLVVAGRGVRNEKDVEMCRELADALGGQLAFTRPMVENGFGDVAHQIGLSGRSFVPMLIGFGCSVPAIMATRTLSSERDRKMTILITPFMSCSAKLPIYGLLTSAFFPKQWRGVVMISLYFAGILCGILYALILKKTKYKGEPVPFVMELPNYRLPSAKSVGQLIWEKAKDFIQKAFTIIFAATLIVWFLQNFDAGLNLVTSTDQSLLAKIGSIVAPLFAPLGFGDWRVSTALITGFMAKESVVSTLTVLLGGNTALLQTLFTPFTAYVFLIFTLLYTPCVAAIATVRREMGTVRAAAGIVAVQCATAWIVAFAVHGVGMMLGL